MITQTHAAYLDHWDPNSQYRSRLQSYQTLNRACELAECLFNQRHKAETDLE